MSTTDQTKKCHWKKKNLQKMILIHNWLIIIWLIIIRHEIKKIWTLNKQWIYWNYNSNKPLKFHWNGDQVTEANYHNYPHDLITAWCTADPSLTRHTEWNKSMNYILKIDKHHEFIQFEKYLFYYNLKSIFSFNLFKIIPQKRNRLLICNAQGYAF